MNGVVWDLHFEWKYRQRAVIALDRAGPVTMPRDAWGAMVDDKTGFAVSGVIYDPEVGHGNEANMMGTQGKKAFITFKDVNHRDRASFMLDPDGKASFKLFDAAGTVAAIC